jgi:peptidoglycan/LPS O-acetylase OafA/YrhL
MNFSFQSSVVRSGKYRPDVDGLRALAVLAVVLFHAGLLGCQGGFVGVDVFYVISGYLITALIASDIAEGKFSFVSFYERRMRRIFPALFGMLFFCILAAVILFAPQDLAVFGKSLVSTTLFISNIYFWRTAQPLGYFSHSSASEALLHTWSLSVEEQFYLVFPAILLLLGWAKRRFNAYLFLLAALSFGLSIWGTKHWPVATFYLFVPRAWELLTGALLATKAVPPLQGRIAREFAGLVGLGMILTAVFCLTTATPFPGFSALLPCLGAGLIIYSGESGASLVKGALSLQPIVFIGVISYSLYLWHWPLLVFSRYFAAGDLTRSETLEVLACSVVMAFLSFEFVEKPFRGARSPVTRRQIYSYGLAASLASAVIGLAVYRTHGLPVRYDPQTRQLVADNVSRRDDYDDNCANWRTDVHGIEDIKFCGLGSNSSKRIMFWGDSHVEQLYPAVKRIISAGDLKSEGALFALANGCLPAEHLNSVGGFHCDAFAHYAMMRAEASDIDTVFIGFNTWWSGHEDLVCASADGRCIQTLSPDETARRFSEELSDHIHTLRGLGKRVIVCLPFPMYDKSIPELEARNAVFGRFGLSGRATDVTSPAIRAEIRSIATSAGAEVFDPRATLCDGQSCITQLNGVSIYRDSQHIAASQVGILGKSLEQVLE